MNSLCIRSYCLELSCPLKFSSSRALPLAAILKRRYLLHEAFFWLTCPKINAFTFSDFIVAWTRPHSIQCNSWIKYVNIIYMCTVRILTSNHVLPKSGFILDQIDFAHVKRNDLQISPMLLYFSPTHLLAQWLFNSGLHTAFYSLY